jgi:hypothetical protein
METTFTINQDSARMLSLPDFKRKLRSRAAYCEGIGLRQSRRVPYLLESGREVMAYTQVFLFLPKGQPEAVEPGIALIRKIYGLQGMEFRFPLHITAYGDQAETLHAKSFQIFNYKRDIGHVIEQLAGGKHTPPHMLTTLRLMSAARNTKIARDDLVLVVTGRLEDLVVSESVKDRLSRHGNSYVVVLNDGIQACRFKDLGFVVSNSITSNIQMI